MDNLYGKYDDSGNLVGVFRNAGDVAPFTATDAELEDCCCEAIYASSVTCDGTFVYTGRGYSGIDSWSVDSDGVLSHIDNDYKTSNYQDVWSDGTLVFAGCYDGLRSYAVDSAGNLTFKDYNDPGLGYGNAQVWGDGTFVYFTRESGLVSYEVSSSGTLTKKDSNQQGSGDSVDVWGDGVFVYAACDSGGVKSYSVDSDGKMTLKDTLTTDYSFHGVGGDGSYLYITGHVTYQVRSASVDGSGNLTLIDFDPGESGAEEVYCDSGYIYIKANDGLLTYTSDSSGNLTRVNYDTQYGGGNYLDVSGDGTFVYTANADKGVNSYDPADIT